MKNARKILNSKEGHLLNSQHLKTLATFWVGCALICSILMSDLTYAMHSGRDDISGREEAGALHATRSIVVENTPLLAGAQRSSDPALHSSVRQEERDASSAALIRTGSILSPAADGGNTSESLLSRLVRGSLYAFTAAGVGQTISSMIRAPLRLLGAEFEDPYIGMLEGLSAAAVFRTLFPPTEIPSQATEKAKRFVGMLAAVGGGCAMDALFDRVQYSGTDFSNADPTRAYRNTIICLFAIALSRGAKIALDKIEECCKGTSDPSTAIQ